MFGTEGTDPRCQPEFGPIRVCDHLYFADTLEVERICHPFECGKRHLQVSKSVFKLRRRLQSRTPSQQEIGPQVVFKRSDTLPDGCRCDTKRVRRSLQRPLSDGELDGL